MLECNDSQCKPNEKSADISQANYLGKITIPLSVTDKRISLIQFQPFRPFLYL